jgi:hypothetical protein
MAKDAMLGSRGNAAIVNIVLSDSTYRPADVSDKLPHIRIIIYGTGLTRSLLSRSYQNTSSSVPYVTCHELDQ